MRWWACIEHNGPNQTKKNQFRCTQTDTKSFPGTRKRQMDPIGSLQATQIYPIMLPMGIGKAIKITVEISLSQRVPRGSFKGRGGPLLLNAPRWIQSWSIWTHNASWCTPKCYKTMNPIPWKNIVGICFSFSATYVHDLCYFTIASFFWPPARTLHHKVPFVILKSSTKTSKVAS